jgi:hypothetical protein
MPLEKTLTLPLSALHPVAIPGEATRITQPVALAENKRTDSCPTPPTTT